MRRSKAASRRLMLALLAVLAAVVAGSATPAATAAAGGAAVECGNWAESNWAFGALDRLAPSSTARGTGRTELVRRGIADGTEISGKKPGVGPNFAATIQTYVHVITDGDEGEVSAEVINQQITVLNMTFAGFRGGANTGFSFVLAGLDYTDNAEWFGYDASTGAGFATELEMKAALKQGDATALNIYVNSGNGYLGYAYYPSIVTSQQYRVLDGVVLHYGSLPGGFIEGFDLGFTATHEVGHWLGLAHTFEQGCIGHGDFVDDTPAMLVPTSGCPEGKDTCTKKNDPGLDPIHNYMDYSDDACYFEFTPGQAERAQTQYLHWRLQHGYNGS